MKKYYRVWYNASIFAELHIEAGSESEALKLVEKQLNGENYDYFVVETVEEMEE